MAYARVTSPLRERLHWLIVAISSGKYGDAVGTRNETFFNHFAAATGARIKSTPTGRACTALSEDLLELFHRGFVTRVIQRGDGSNDTSKSAWFYAYRITAAGRRAAETGEGKSRVTLESHGDGVLDGIKKS